MAYSVDTYRKSRTIIVEDGTIDNSLDIRLIGKNYAGYGEVQNENFLHLLENFAGLTPPAKPINGQIWYDSSVRKLKYYDSAAQQWKTVAGSQVASAAPAGLSTGDLWWDNVNQQLYVKDDANFILIGPQGVPGLDTTEMVSDIVEDNTTNPNNTHGVIKAFVNGKVSFVISSSTFVLGVDTPIAGFTNIKRGITLANTNNEGITNTDVNAGDIFWGTVSASNALVGSLGQRYTADSFFLKSSSTPVQFLDVGYTLGNGADLEVKIDTDGVTPLIKTLTGTTLKFQTQGNTPLKLVGANVLPGSNLTNLGSTSETFNNVYATSYFGNGANLSGLNATNVATTTTSANANFFVPFVALATTGNQSLGIDAGLAYNPSTNAMTAGINGGTF
jgi:hypothetical protein